MAINTSVENINNQPTIEPQTVTGIFTKYIAKTLPLAFDESMSYYECLCTLLEYLNEDIVPDINNTNDGLSELQVFYLDLQSYVNNYFDNLDVQQEINNKLDEMAQDGSLTNLIKAYVNPIYESYEEQINSEVQDMEDRLNAVASGSPQGVYDTLTALQTADPDHDRIYLVLADGKWYYYNSSNSTWTAGGTYQSTEVGNGTITYDKLAPAVRDGYDLLKAHNNNPITFSRTLASTYGEVTNDASGNLLYIIDKPETDSSKASNATLYANVIPQATSFDMSTYEGENHLYALFHIQHNAPNTISTRLQYNFYKSDFSAYAPTASISLKDLTNNFFVVDITNKWLSTNEHETYPKLLWYGLVCSSTTSEIDATLTYYGLYTKTEIDNGLNLVEQLNNIRNDIEENKEAIENMGRNIVISANFDRDAYLYREEIPSYYFDTENTESFENNQYLDKKIASLPNGKHFIFITDTHYPRNKKNSTKLIQYIRKRANIHSVVFGGDILDQDTSKYIGALNLKKYMNDMRSCFSEEYYVTFGNHDLNVANANHYPDIPLDDLRIPYSVVQPILTDNIKGIAHFDNETTKLTQIISNTSDRQQLIDYFKLHYYIDDNEQKIRYIVLNTGSSRNGLVNDYFGVSSTSELMLQLDWLYETLLSTPENYIVAVSEHVAIEWTTDQLTWYNLAVTNLLRGLLQKTTVEIDNDRGITKLNNLWYEAGVHSYDFTNANTIQLAFIVGGDTHYDLSCVAKNNDGVMESYTFNNNWNLANGDILTVVTQCDAYNNTDGGTHDFHPMTNNTITEQCFDIVTITPQNNIVFTRIGAGDDRTFNHQ